MMQHLTPIAVLAALGLIVTNAGHIILNSLSKSSLRMSQAHQQATAH